VSEQAPARPGRSSRTRRTARLEAFSDGVFAIAITLLVLDLAAPATSNSVTRMLSAVGDEWPGYLGYIVSFATIGALWLGHSAITEDLDHANTILLRLNLLLLLFVSFLPFPTRLLFDYVSKGEAEKVASTFYGITLLVAAALLWLLWRYAQHARLVRSDVKDEEITLLTQRLSPGLAGYGLFIVIGLFAPFVAVAGYLVIALFFLLPVPMPRRRPRRS
jgi:uncharacterized membrane protein